MGFYITRFSFVVYEFEQTIKCFYMSLLQWLFNFFGLIDSGGFLWVILGVGLGFG